MKKLTKDQYVSQLTHLTDQLMADVEKDPAILKNLLADMMNEDGPMLINDDERKLLITILGMVMAQYKIL